MLILAPGTTLGPVNVQAIMNLEIDLTHARQLAADLLQAAESDCSTHYAQGDTPGTERFHAALAAAISACQQCSREVLEAAAGLADSSLLSIAAMEEADELLARELHRA